MAWSSPVPVGTRIGSNFGPRGGILHAGDDYPPKESGDQNTPFFFLGDGVVVGTGSGLLAGHSGDRNILVQHPGGIVSYYGHNNRCDVKRGERVVGGEQGGIMGFRGNTVPAGPRGTHLHLGVLVNGRFVDPSVFLASKGIIVGKTPPVKAGRVNHLPGVTSKSYPYVLPNPNSIAQLDVAWATLLYAAGYQDRYLKTRFRKWLRDAGTYKGAINTSRSNDEAQVLALQKVLRNIGNGAYKGLLDAKRGPMMRASELAHLKQQQSSVRRINETGLRS